MVVNKHKKISIVLLIIMILILIISSAEAYYRDNTWECTSRGEKSQGDFYGRSAGNICKYMCCIKCVSRYPSVNCFGSGADPMCSCTSGNSSDVDLTPPIVTINTPIDGILFDVKSIPFDVDFSEEIKRAYINYGSSHKLLCSNCNDVNKNIAFSDGTYTVEIEATDFNENTGYANVSFSVDTKMPSIIKTYPEDGEYIESGEFSVEYNEENLRNIVLHYGVNANDKAVTLTNCKSGKKESCSVNVSLAGYDNTAIEYYFTVSDYINSVNSETLKVFVDDVAPVLILNNSGQTLYSERKVLIEVKVNENVTLEYIDYAIKKPRYKKLCKDCDSYNFKKSLNDGFYNLTFRGIDNGNNSGYASVSFSVDTKEPKVKKVEPNKFGNGSFCIYYDENNLDGVWIHYGLEKNNYVASSVTCMSGKYQKCCANIDVNSYYGNYLYYYFVLSDTAGNMVSSKLNRVKIDNIKPTLDLISPVESNVYNDDKVLITANVTDDNFDVLEYSVDGKDYKTLSTKKFYSSTKTFKTGNHLLKVRALDEAGNSDEKIVSFSVA